MSTGTGLPHRRERVGVRGSVSLGLSIVGALSLVACAGVTRVSMDAMPPVPTESGSRLFEPGPIEVRVRQGEIKGEYGCTVAYETYEPAERRSKTMVFLAHGFMRSLKSMEGWAAHWASFGVGVTVMTLCNSTWLAGRHHRNAADLALLARTVHEGPVMYAGFSAGGLAALLAAVDDENAVAYLGLDPVDSGKRVQAKRDALSLPVLFLLAEPGSCNADSNASRDGVHHEMARDGVSSRIVAFKTTC